MIEHSQDITKLAEALHGFQGAVHGVVKDSKNPHFKNNYASLEAVVLTARPMLQQSGIAFTQAPGAIVDGSVEVTTMLVHTSGQWMRSTLHVPLGKRDPQGVGSAITYGCRYALMATLGLPPVDDDGEGAMDRCPPKPQAKTEAPPASDRTVANTLKLSLKSARNSVDLQKWLGDNTAAIDGLPESLKDEVRSAYSAKLHDLRSAA